MIQGQPRTKEKDERIAEISAAAKKIFLEKGYFNSTVEEIAKEAGVSKGTVYLYFKNKDELYASLMLPSIGDVNQMLRRLEADVVSKKYKTGSEIVMRFHDWMSKLYKRESEGLRILQVYQLLDLSKVMDEKARQKHWEMARESMRLSARIVTAAMQQGLLPRMNPHLLISIMWGSFLGIVQDQDSKLRTKGKGYSLQTLRACFKIFAEGLTRMAVKSAKSEKILDKTGTATDLTKL
jgi:AcrR family transcriptional regulator